MMVVLMCKISKNVFLINTWVLRSYDYISIIGVDKG